jgi:hypothetical protein
MTFKRYPVRWLRTLAILLFLLCPGSQLIAADVSLAWDASVTPEVVGYKVYYGNSPGVYGTSISIGNQTTYTVTGLTSGTYYFAVSALDGSGNESDFSNEVSQIIGSSTQNCNLNGDAEVNVLDLQLLANVILGITTGNYDLNSDGRVDVLDLQILNNVILGLRSCP